MNELKKTKVLCMVLLTGALLGGLVASCAHRAAGPAPLGRARGARLYYPARAGYIWAYDLRDPLERHSLFTVLKVIEADEEHAVLESGLERFQRNYDSSGVRRDDMGAYLLRKPLKVGTTWDLPAGGRGRITELGVEVKTRAGKFEDCLVVEETVDEIVVRKILAPGVGPVHIQVLRVHSGGHGHLLLNEATLRSFSSGEKMLRGPGVQEP